MSDNFDVASSSNTDIFEVGKPIIVDVDTSITENFDADMAEASSALRRGRPVAAVGPLKQTAARYQSVHAPTLKQALVQKLKQRRVSRRRESTQSRQVKLDTDRINAPVTSDAARQLEASKLQETIDSLVAETHQARSEIEMLNSRVSIRETEIQTMSNTINDLEAKLVSASEVNARLASKANQVNDTGEVTALQSSLVDRDATIAGLRSELEIAANAANQYQLKIQRYDVELTNAQQALKSAVANCDTAARNNADVQTQLDTTNRDLTLYKDRFDAATRLIKDAQGKIAKNEEQANNLAAEIQSYTQRLSAAQQKIDSLDSERLNILDTLEIRSNERDGALQSAKQASDEASQLKMQIAQFEQRELDANSRIRVLEAQALRNDTDVSATVQAEIHRREAELNLSIGKMRDEYRANLDAANARATNLAAELSSVTAQLADATRRRDVASANVAAQVSEVNIRATELFHQLTISNSRIDELEQRLDEANKLLDVAANDVSDSDARLQAIKDSLRDREETILKLENGAATMSEQVIAQRSTIVELETRLNSDALTFERRLEEMRANSAAHVNTLVADDASLRGAIANATQERDNAIVSVKTLTRANELQLAEIQKLRNSLQDETRNSETQIAILKRRLNEADNIIGLMRSGSVTPGQMQIPPAFDLDKDFEFDESMDTDSIAAQTPREPSAVNTAPLAAEIQTACLQPSIKAFGFHERVLHGITNVPTSPTITAIDFPIIKIAAGKFELVPTSSDDYNRLAQIHPPGAVYLENGTVLIGGVILPQVFSKLPKEITFTRSGYIVASTLTTYTDALTCTICSNIVKSPELARLHSQAHISSTARPVVISDFSK